MTAKRFTNPVFVALDTPDLERAYAVAKAVAPYVGGLKIGLEFKRFRSRLEMGARDAVQ